MADEPNPKPTSPTPDPPPKPDQPDPEALAERIGTSVGKHVAATLAQMREQREEPPAAPVSRETLETVSDGDIEAAYEAGDEKRARSLERKQRRIEQEKQARQFSEQMAQGAEALGQVAETSVINHPTFKRYGPEVRARINQFKKDFPGAVITAGHWQTAMKLVRAEHVDDEIKEAREETIRQQRDDANPPTPTGSTGRVEEPEEEDPKNFREMFNPAFVRERWGAKARGVGGRTEDDEIRRLSRTRFKGDEKRGIPAASVGNTFGEFVKTRKEMERFVEEHPSLGLDE